MGGPGLRWTLVCNNDWFVCVSYFPRYTISVLFGPLDKLYTLTLMIGTVVYWHATMNPCCGITNITIDHDARVFIDASQGTTTNSTPVPTILYATDGLQSGESLLIIITFFAARELGGPYLEMYNLLCVEVHANKLILKMLIYCR